MISIPVINYEAMDAKSFLSANVTVSGGEVMPFSNLLTRPLNVFHLQDSCGSGRVCRVAGAFFEDALPDLIAVASVTIIHPDDAFDRAPPPPTLTPPF